ncbi:MAG: Crp/Fnr family transcriptional regulator [Bacteroidia bacterium]
MLNNFLNILSEIIPISKELREHLQKKISVQRLPKLAVLLAEGQVCDKLFFICEGLLRVYYFEKEEEITSRIVIENSFVYSPSSFIQNKPSIETIQLLEDSTFICMNKNDLEEMFIMFPETTYMALKITERYLLINDSRARALRLPANDRYLLFQKQYPGVVSRIKVQYLASYLGLSRSCLNLFRSKIITNRMSKIGQENVQN